MIKANFTKREWVVTDGAYPSFVNVDCGGMMDIAICWSATDLSFADGQERLANAHLIAAAPKMYKALQSIMDSPYTDLKSEDFEMIELVLAKARGEHES